MKKITAIFLVLMMLCATFALTSCVEVSTNGSEVDRNNTLAAGGTLQTNQPTPTDIDYSLERYNLIRRAYWVNGQREKANTLPCAVEKPLGYVVLFSGNVVIGNFIVDGKVSSLNSYLTPDSMYYEVAGDYVTGSESNENEWLPDIDGTYGSNDNGIFFFTPDGKYIEWTGTYLYSDIPFEVDSPILNIGGNK